MENRRNLYLAMFFAMMLSLLLAFYADTFLGSTSQFLLPMILAAVLLSANLFFIFRTLNRNPTTKTLSIIGFPGSGKTVYLTVLFDKLQQSKMKNIRFAPYGEETIERVLRDVYTLSSGKWLPPTEIGGLFYYRANVAIESPLSPLMPNLSFRYKLEIGDFAGEYFKSLTPSDEIWLHKGQYFKYVTQSEGVLLAVDSAYLLSKSLPEVELLQNAYVAAIQVFADSKGAMVDKKISTPVALLFMKSDLIREDEFESLPSSVSRLISVCENRCANFHYFFVSSVGKLSEEDAPPTSLNPSGVIEPLLWILKRS